MTNNTSQIAPETYQSYRGLPSLAGLGSFPAAMNPGLSVEESVKRLKRHHYALRRIHTILLAKLTAEPIYELKMSFSYHAFLSAEAVSLLRARVGEMREPPLGLDKIPHPAMELFFDEICCAEKIEEVLLGIYEVALPDLIEGVKRHMQETHIVADQPTIRIARQILADANEMLAWGEQAIRALVTVQVREAAKPYLSLLSITLACMGSIDGSKPTREGAPERYYSNKPFQYDKIPKRDERFHDPFNQGVNPEVLLYDEEKPVDAKILMMFFKRIREIDVPEMMASILIETPDKPWEYYHDMTRQLWDEARHAMLGEIGFVSLGIDWAKYTSPNVNWSHNLNTQLKPDERHAVLYYIEQGLMPKTGKRFEWEVSIMGKNPLATTFQDFDWADEVLHARVGRDWYVSAMPSSHDAIEKGDKCWARVMSNWEGLREKGLTQHRNWWPDLYAEYCKNTGTTPDPKTAQYDTSYDGIRPDLKEMSYSA